MCRARDLCQTFSICHPGEKLASVWADLTLVIKEIGWLPIPRFPCSFVVFSSSSQSLQGTGNSSGACVAVNNMPAWSCDQEMAKTCFSLTNRSFCLCMLWTTKPASSSLQWAQLRRDSGDPHWWKAWRNQRGKDCITLHCKAAMSLTRVGLFSLKIYRISLPKCELWLFPVVFSKHVLISVSCYSIQFSFIYLAPNQNNYHPKGALHCKVQTLLLHRILCKTMNTCMFTTTES